METRQLNVAIDAELLERVRRAADKQGMLLRRWVEFALEYALGSGFVRPAVWGGEGAVERAAEVTGIEERGEVGAGEVGGEVGAMKGTPYQKIMTGERGQRNEPDRPA